MRALLGRPIFTAGEQAYLWADVVLFAVLRGEWNGIVDRARAGLAALEREAAGDEALVEDDEIEAESDRFRYERDLVSVDDTERWLSVWGLDVEAWLTWIRADLLRKKLEADGAGDRLAEATDVDEDDLEGALLAEAACSGTLSRLARELAARVAITLAVAEDEPRDVADDGRRVDSIDLSELDVEALRAAFAPAELQERVAAVVRADRTFLSHRDRVVTPDAVAARIRAHQGDWMRVDCRILTAESEDVAREALLSIQEDGEEMTAVAEGAGCELKEGTFYLEELDPAFGDHVLAARKGELLGPVRTADGFALVAVLDKRLASPEDAEVRSRAERSLFESAVERETDDRISWRWGR